MILSPRASRLAAWIELGTHQQVVQRTTTKLAGPLVWYENGHPESLKKRFCSINHVIVNDTHHTLLMSL